MALRKYTVTVEVPVSGVLTARDAAMVAARQLYSALWYVVPVGPSVVGRDSLSAFTVTGEDGHTSRIDLGTDEKFSAQATEALR